MAKWLWVIAPIAVFAAAVGLRALVRRPLSRALLNAWSSVLLLAYLLTTAGLGIFWVANQQLPVFDWHYLFGYATVLLVVLHLSFNLPTAWRIIVRSRRLPVARAPAPAPARRGATAALGVVAGAAAVGLFGWMWRRDGGDGRAAAGSGDRVDAPTPPTAAVDPPRSTGPTIAAVERFHALASHSRRGLLLRAPDLAWRSAPPAFKRIAGAERVALRPARTVVATAARGLDRDALGAALWHTAGVTLDRGGLQLRASPSSGALFSTELYAVVGAGAVDGLAAGAWHYDAERHAFERIDGAPPRAEAPAGQLVVVATAVFARTGHKYRDRAYRYVLADLGHALENLRVAAASLGAGARLATAFDEAEVARAIGVDGVDEGVLAVIALGADGAGGGDDVAGGAPPGASRSVRIGEPAAASASAPRRQRIGATAEAPASASRAIRIEPVDAAPAQGWRHALADPADAAATRTPRDVTEAIHRATSLRRPTRDVEPGTAALDGLAWTRRTPAAPDRSTLARIATRRSLRRFDASALPLRTLDAIVDAIDAAPRALLSPAVRLHVVAHRVAGLAPRVWRRDPSTKAWRATTPAAASAADLAAASRAAALDQEVIGEPPAVVVLSIDRAAFAADAFGAGRGYRHAFLEAGMVGERLYLAALANGAGACAVGAFYDDEAARLVGVDPAREWVVHFCAIGRPAA